MDNKTTETVTIKDYNKEKSYNLIKLTIISRGP